MCQFMVGEICCRYCDSCSNVYEMCMNTTDAKSVRVDVIYLLTVEIDS